MMIELRRLVNVSTKELTYMPIMPVGMFDIIDTSGSQDAFILPAVWKESHQYRSYYRDKQWRTVVIDNDVYENGEATPFENILEVANELSASQIYIVGDEKVGSGYETIKLIEDQISNSGLEGTTENGCPWQLMCVLQGSISEMRLMRKVFFNKINAWAIPVSLFRDGYDRNALASYLAFTSTEYVHALGLDNIFEIHNLRQGTINSFDTSIPATAAVHMLDLANICSIPRTGKDTYDRVDLECDDFEDDELNVALEGVMLLKDIASFMA